jgi:hypothetical protein
MYLTKCLILPKLRIQSLNLIHQMLLNWELDDYQLERLKELGLHDTTKDDGSEFISRL